MTRGGEQRHCEVEGNGIETHHIRDDARQQQALLMLVWALLFPC